MADATIDRSATSNIFHVFIGNSSVTTGAGLTGLSNASSGLIISAMKPGDASATVYSVASSNVETITTIGTYAAPSSGKIRFKEIDSTNRPGWYEFHPANALFSVSADTTVTFTFIGATNMRATSFTVQVGSPANMTRIDGSATSGNNATLYLKALNIQNSAGNAIHAESTLAGSHGIYGKGSGSGVGIKGKGGNGTLGTPATAAPGIEGEGGDAFRVGVDTDTGLEWGGPGIRGLAAGKGTPGITAKGKDGGPGLYIFTDGSGPMNSPPIKILCSSSAIAAVDVDFSTGATSFIRLLNGSSSGLNGLDAQGVSNFTNWFIPKPNVGVAASVTQLNALIGETLNVTAATNNTVTMGDLAGIYPDGALDGFLLVCSNFQSCVVTDYVGSTGLCTIRCLLTESGNWVTNPDPGTPDTVQFASFPFELKSSIASTVMDAVVESGISASSSLTNDTGTQLTSINLQQAIALIASAVVGKLAGAATTNITTKQVGKPSGNTRIDATVDSNGNRSALTLKVPD